MLESLLQSSYFALFLIVALGFILGRINFKGISLDVSAVIFIASGWPNRGISMPPERMPWPSGGRDRWLFPTFQQHNGCRPTLICCHLPVFETGVVRLKAREATVKRLDFDFTEMPDLVQSFVVACCLQGKPFVFSGVETLRIKETDRIAALIEETLPGLWAGQLPFQKPSALPVFPTPLPARHRPANYLQINRADTSRRHGNTPVWSSGIKRW